MRSVLSHRRAPAAYAVRRCRLPRSRAATSKRALARIQRLCCLGIGSEMLMPDLMREVMRLVPSRHGQFCWAGANAEIANFYGTFPRSVMELFLKEFYRTRLETDFIGTFSNHRLWPMSTPVLQLSQTPHCDSRAFRLSDFYNVLWRQADIDEPPAADCTGSGSHPRGAVCLPRAGRSAVRVGGHEASRSNCRLRGARNDPLGIGRRGIRRKRGSRAHCRRHWRHGTARRLSDTAATDDGADRGNRGGAVNANPRPS